MYKNVLSSILPLVITLILFVIVGNYGIGRIQNLRSQISQVEKDKTSLTQKLNTLQTVSATVEAGSTSSIIALPEKNSALTEFVQLKSLAAQNSVTLTNLKSGGEAKDSSGLSRVDISFDVSGSRLGIITFLSEIQKTLPISLVDRIKFNESAAQIQAAVSVKSFWAGFPKTIPSVTQKIADLTQDERNTLDKISTLTPPQFVEIPVSETSGGRADPFTP